MLNWRRPLLLAGLRIVGNNVPDNLEKLKTLEKNQTELKHFREGKLRSLLNHAFETVPFYRERLRQSGIVTDSGINLDRFEELPLLTKKDIRQAGDDLRSRSPGPNPYTNTSGGTTGEPVQFYQDDDYWQWNVANKIYYQSMAGKKLGEPEVKLWGSERDIEQGSRSLKTRIRNFLYNRRALNSFKMGDGEMDHYVKEINEFQPKTIWTYVESIHQLARFVERNDLQIHSPAGIVSTAGTLHEPIRELVENVFDTTVHNQYGSREVGDIACECSHQEGLHIFSHTNYVEVVDEQGKPVESGEEGHVVVTNLNNYSMPLIRYRIGDMAIPSDSQCSCGRAFPLLEQVTGRVSDHFVTPTGDLVHGEYFTHLFYDIPWVEQFQVRQLAHDEILVVVTTANGTEVGDTTPLTDAIQDVMGSDVSVQYETRNRIEPADSGKFRYTISEVTR